MTLVTSTTTGVFTVAWENPPRGMRKAYAQARRESLESAITHWFVNRLPVHFTRAAVALYGFKSRTREHEIRKARRYGHRDPLVFSGTMKRAILRRMPPVVHRGRYSQIRWTQLPRYTYIVSTLEPVGKGKKRRAVWIQRPDKTVELTTVAPQEAQALGEIFEKGFSRRVMRLSKGKG
ncbi:MAG: hypothetical protein HYV27_15305 [Candidatus Hydrogenedentes bacterium]|nr:hypothetical protein [Candidatus Hydrogenedentota bacterium]